MSDFGSTSCISPTMRVKERFQKKFQSPMEVLEDVLVAAENIVLGPSLGAVAETATHLPKVLNHPIVPKLPQGGRHSSIRRSWNVTTLRPAQSKLSGRYKHIDEYVLQPQGVVTTLNDRAFEHGH